MTGLSKIFWTLIHKIFWTLIHSLQRDCTLIVQEKEKGSGHASSRICHVRCSLVRAVARSSSLLESQFKISVAPRFSESSMPYLSSDTLAGRSSKFDHACSGQASSACAGRLKRGWLHIPTACLEWPPPAQGHQI